MALKKETVTPANVAASYHRIAGVFVLDRERLLEIHVESYVDEATRRETVELEDPSGAIVPKWSPLARSVAKATAEHFTALFGAGVPEYPQKVDLYAYLKTLPEFAGAVDA